MRVLKKLDIFEPTFGTEKYFFKSHIEMYYYSVPN